MAENEGTQTQSQTQQTVSGSSRPNGSSSSSSRGGRRGRGGRGRAQHDAASGRGGRNTPSQPPRAASEPHSSESTPGQDIEGSSASTSVPARGGGGRGRRRPQPRQNSRRAAPPPQRTAGGRSFGGHLTAPANESESSSAATAPSLSADAPEFVPGQTLATRRWNRPERHSSNALLTSSSKPAARKEARPRIPKSSAADLATRIHEDISHANYECAICTDDVLRTSQVWSCTICWTVVHLKCVKKWYGNQKKQHDEARSTQPEREFSWRCPGCNSKLADEPGSYHCWCGKDVNPTPASKTLPPHSCGQTCSKPRGTCPHPCPLQCHAGPCPPCTLMGPEQSCFCGKNSSRKLCRETDYENGWSCQEVCADLMPCGEHMCEKVCHAGLCGDCAVMVDVRCYCARLEKQMPCFERDEPQQSFDPPSGTWFEASFNCGNACDRFFDCGNHRCSKPCHAQDEQPAHCPLSPDLVSHCPCGKTPLDELIKEKRTSCEDPIPRCEKPCEKPLPCGHLCKAKCHTGDCGFCFETVDIPCRCGRVSSRSICHQGDVQHPLCMRTCQANLSCGRHKCGEHCCPGEKKAAERAAAKRKHRHPDQQITAIEAEHICIKTCGRPLKCGSHNCQQMCHRGPCGSCPEAIFHEISCDCGRTVLQPPQPCGTRPPECRFDCLRRPSCGHPPVSHNCHSDDISCPKCPFLVEKWCACGKEKLRSQPCHLQEAYCGRICGKDLKCGLHKCKKLCHRDGECEDAGTTTGQCAQTCGKTKLFCEHPCQKSCHGLTPCNESAPCPGKVMILCPCGLRKQEVKCLASSSNPTPSHPEIKCDDECLRLDRNRRLAAALNIDPASHTTDHVPYSDTTLRIYQENRSWAETQEREFRVFAASPNESRLRYKPMPSAQREFLHTLAEDFGLESMSEDPEPQRYVVVYKGPRFVSAPTKTLAQCVKIRAKQVAEAAAAAEASRPPSPPIVPQEPFNAILLASPRFGLTIDEVKSALEADLASQPSIRFNIDFLTATEEVLMRATSSYSAFLSPPALEQSLVALKTRIATTIGQHELAGSVLLCHVDANDEVTRKENLSQHSAAGWSAVAGRAASRKASPLPDEAAAKSSGRKLLGLKKKKVDKERDKTWSALGGDVEC